MVLDLLRKFFQRNPAKAEERLPFKQKASHGVGHILNDLAASVWFSYLIIYLTKVAGLPNRHTGLVLFLGQIADALFTPFVGILCDRTVCRYGRRKIWHLLGCILTSLSFPLIFIRILPNDATDTLKVCYYVGIAAVFQFGWGCVQISHLTLIPEISKKSSERVELNAIRSALTFICGIYVYGVTWILLGESSEETLTPNVWKQFMYLSFIIVGSGNVFNVIFHVFTKEPPSKALLDWKEKYNKKKCEESVALNGSKASSRVVYCQSPPSTSRSSGASPSVRVTLCDDKKSCNGVTGRNASSSDQIPLVAGDEEGRNLELEIIDRTEDSLHARPGMTKLQWLKNPNLYIVAMMYMSTRIVVNISQSYLPLYLTDTMKFNKEAIAYFPLVVLTSGVVASLGVKPLNKKLGNKMTFVLGSLMALCACFWFHVQPVAHRNAIYATTVIMGCGGSVMLVSALSLIAHLVGNDNQSGAFIYGAISFTDKLSSGAVIAIIQEFTPPRTPGECPDCDLYTRNIQSLAPGVAALLALFVGLVLFEPAFVCKRRVTKHDKVIQTDNYEFNDPNTQRSIGDSLHLYEKHDHHSFFPEPVFDSEENSTKYDDKAVFDSKENSTKYDDKADQCRDTTASVVIWEKRTNERLHQSRAAKNISASLAREDGETGSRLAQAIIPSPLLNRRTIV